MLDADDWGAIVNHGTVYGVGDDNPLDPYQLTQLQSMRSVMIMFEQMSSFQVRYAIGACCTTGRNFIVGGYDAPCAIAAASGRRSLTPPLPRRTRLEAGACHGERPSLQASAVAEGRGLSAARTRSGDDTSAGSGP